MLSLWLLIITIVLVTFYYEYNQHLQRNLDLLGWTKKQTDAVLLCILGAIALTILAGLTINLWVRPEQSFAFIFATIPAIGMCMFDVTRLVRKSLLSNFLQSENVAVLEQVKSFVCVYLPEITGVVFVFELIAELAEIRCCAQARRILFILLGIINWLTFTYICLGSPGMLVAFLCAGNIPFLVTLLSKRSSKR